MGRQRRCRICHKRPPWHRKNCPPGVTICVDRPAARRAYREADRAAATDPLADFAGPLVYDGYLGIAPLRGSDPFSGDPLDAEAIAV
jgi:hypothetical protein